MTLFNVALKGLGASVIVLMLAASSQAQTNLLQSKTLKSPKPLASALGGPITPSDPNLFLGANSALLQPITLENATSEDGSPLKAPPLLLGPPEPIAPLVDDPPRPSGGGLFNIKTD
jgi:hypothetical protein